MTQPNDGYNHDPELRARIQAFSPDEPGVVFPFSARLAREHGWTRAFAEQVVKEYRRFLYLAMTAGHPVTPSVQVDEAWHLHLTYTRSYWDELCGRVLGRPLHHEPTKGGAAEGAKFVDWYARTLESYRAAFGQGPPRDIWPAPGERFAAEGRVRQVSDATHWIVRKPRSPRRAATAVTAFSALFLVGACMGVDAGAWLFGGVLLAGLVVLGFAASAAADRSLLAGTRHDRSKQGDSGGGSCGTSGGLFTSSDSGGDCGDGGSGCSGCGGCGGD
ncbi:MAG TPA: hypothetical protein VFR37_00780 [Longimicrobium sp.]|nr:hypothetical protein [Longimicrobium sp.]